ncbi:uncharacterized protein [Argopecten irradians]|uniref:uncharacterized protein n=1 Tax=Argopecten irradians TaxID=31199 RepID=UPI003722D1C2
MSPYVQDNPKKRILLSDPAYVQQQLTHLQSELQTLQATVLSQTSQLQSHQDTIHKQNEEMQTMKATVQSQTNEISSLKHQLIQAENVFNKAGSTFVRWGRTDCPVNVTELVYSGYAGGSWYNHQGAAAGHLCLPSDPEWLNTTVVPDDDTGRIYGAEYQGNMGHTMFGSTRDEDVPCAVCRPTFFASSLMIPARKTCYSGWTKAYSGTLVSGDYDHPAATEYVCMDENDEPIVGGADRNDNGLLFYGVKAFCGSLRCPPYKQDAFIACVVCMK